MMLSPLNALRDGRLKMSAVKGDEMKSKKEFGKKKVLSGDRTLHFKNFYVQISEGPGTRAVKPGFSRDRIHVRGHGQIPIEVVVDLVKREVWVNNAEVVECTQGREI